MSKDRNIAEIKHYVKVVLDMRKQQKEFFRTGKNSPQGQLALKKAIELEHIVDKKNNRIISILDTL